MGQYSTTAYRKASSNGSGTQPEYPGILASIASQNNKNLEQANPPQPGDPADASFKPRRESVSHKSPKASFGGSWSSILDPDPFINFQDVRCLGPLLDPSKLELDTDREIAKKQWRELCATHVLKQKVATALWDKSRELEVRCRDTNVRYESIRKELNAVSAAREEVEAENSRLKEEVRHTRNMKAIQQENTSKWRDVELDKMRSRFLYQQGEIDRLRIERNSIRSWAWHLGMGVPLLMLLNVVYPHASAF